jgi:hypothetical protein
MVILNGKPAIFGLLMGWKVKWSKLAGFIVNCVVAEFRFCEDAMRVGLPAVVSW